MPFWLKARSFPLGLPRTSSLGRWPLDGRAMATIPPAELHKKNAKGVLLSRDAVTKLLSENGMLQEIASALLDALAAHPGVKKQQRKQAMMVDMGKFRKFVYGGSPEKKTGEEGGEEAGEVRAEEGGAQDKEGNCHSEAGSHPGGARGGQGPARGEGSARRAVARGERRPLLGRARRGGVLTRRRRFPDPAAST